MSLRHYLEYAGLRGFIGLIDRMSPRASIKLSSTLADMFYALNAGRRNTAIDNILKSGITEKQESAARIARESFRNFAIMIVESLKSHTAFNADNWREKLEVNIPEKTMSLLNDPAQGVILVSGHFGNWEIAAQLMSYLKPVVGVTRKMNNPYTDKLMNERKPRNRFRLTPKRDADSTRFLNILKKGEMLALMIDQHARDHNIPIDFFGRPAQTYTTPAMLHLVTKTPICFGYCLRTGPMSYTLNASEPVTVRSTGNKRKDVELIMTDLTKRLEAVIREHPEQYLWAHRRWRTSDKTPKDSRFQDPRFKVSLS